MTVAVRTAGRRRMVTSDVWDVEVSGDGRHPKDKELYWNLRTTGHWYDFVITSDSDSSFYRRVAGHVETGRASVSDPGMGAADRF